MSVEAEAGKVALIERDYFCKIHIRLKKRSRKDAKLQDDRVGPATEGRGWNRCGELIEDPVETQGGT